MGNSRRIMHVDMDAFFAAIELKRHPEFVGKPVIVGGSGDPTQRGVVSTASYDARKFGVASAMPLRTASKLCPHAIFLPVDYHYYVQISKRIKAILREVSPFMEDVSIDEAFLDISHLPDSSEDIASLVKTRILDATGLSCSIGVASNKLLAKMASDLEKPGGLTILAMEDVERRIWPLPVRKLYGVGPKTEERLNALGVETIGELASVALETLLAQFGPSFGTYLYYAARGEDDRPLITCREPKSISREVTFQEDVGKSEILGAVMARLTREVANQLRKQGYRGRTVTVKLRYHDFETHTHALTLPRGTDSFKDIRSAAGRCLKRFALIKKVRLIGIRVSGLEK